MKLDARELLSILMILGSFGLLGGYLFSGGHLDSGTGVALAVFCTAPITSILGFYFGKQNGAQEALANSALVMSQAAIQAAAQRRTGDPPTVSAPVTVVPPGS